MTWAAMVHVALKAAAMAEERGWSTMVVDLRSIVPLDEEAIVAAAQRTGRVVVLHEAPRTAGFGGEIAAIVAERAIEHLRAPILRVTGFDTPFPYSLEHEYMPNADRVLGAIRQTLEW